MAAVDDLAITRVDVAGSAGIPYQCRQEIESGRSVQSLSRPCQLSTVANFNANPIKTHPANRFINL
jgi:hypothetical protein